MNNIISYQYRLRAMEAVEMIRDEHRTYLKKLVTYIVQNNLMPQKDIARVTNQHKSVVSRWVIREEKKGAK